MEIIGMENHRVLAVHRGGTVERTLLLANLGDATANVVVSLLPGHWRNAVDSADETWRGKGSLLPREFAAAGENEFSILARSCALFVRDKEHPSPSA
jgi:hypothetical protein